MPKKRFALYEPGLGIYAVQKTFDELVRRCRTLGLSGDAYFRKTPEDAEEDLDRFVIRECTARLEDAFMRYDVSTAYTVREDGLLDVFG